MAKKHEGLNPGIIIDEDQRIIYWDAMLSKEALAAGAAVNTVQERGEREIRFAFTLAGKEYAGVVVLSQFDPDEYYGWTRQGSSMMRPIGRGKGPKCSSLTGLIKSLGRRNAKQAAEDARKQAVEEADIEAGKAIHALAGEEWKDKKYGRQNVEAPIPGDGRDRLALRAPRWNGAGHRVEVEVQDKQEAAEIYKVVKAFMLARRHAQQQTT